MKAFSIKIVKYRAEFTVNAPMDFSINIEKAY